MTFLSIAKKAYKKILLALPDEASIRFAYLYYYKRPLSLKNPQTFNEKTAWRKLYQRDPRFVIFSDKVTAKEEVAKIIGAKYIIPNMWVGERPEEIPFATLEPPYVIKVNHGSGSHIFIRKKEDINREEIIKRLRDALAYPYGYILREWAYSKIPRKILIEPMIKTKDGEVPEDYKFFTYHGRVHYIDVHCDRYTGEKLSYFDTDWNLLDCLDPVLPPVGREIPRPENLEKMISLAEKIGAQFDFVRVDFYDSSPDVLFGEATFYSAGGLHFFNTREWDLKFGEPWHTKKYEG